MSTRMPVIFVSHGGGPWPWVEGMREAFATTEREFAKLPQLLPEKPRAVLVITGHWEESEFTVSTGAHPPMEYDYTGFPPHTYEVVYPAPGAPELATHIVHLLRAAGLVVNEDPSRGFDHGVFVPLKVSYPDANVPTVQLSLQVGLDPARHLAIGKALAPLRDEGVLLLGSGMSFHDLRRFGSPAALAPSERFDAWLATTCAASAAERDAGLVAWQQAPSATQCHPREEHLLPLMVCAGAAGTDRGRVVFRDTVMQAVVSAVQFG
jgi:aromatic ring-opening dioxygenase catalytic subunit (LigB family)